MLKAIGKVGERKKLFSIARQGDYIIYDRGMVIYWISFYQGLNKKRRCRETKNGLAIKGMVVFILSHDDSRGGAGGTC